MRTDRVLYCRNNNYCYVQINNIKLYFIFVLFLLHKIFHVTDRIKTIINNKSDNLSARETDLQYRYYVS